MARSQPLWKSPWFWAACGGFALLSIRDARRAEARRTPKATAPGPKPPPQKRETAPKNPGVVLRWSADGQTVTRQTPGSAPEKFSLGAVGNAQALAGFATDAAYATVVEFNQRRTTPNWTLTAIVPKGVPDRANVVSKIQKTIQRDNTPLTEDTPSARAGQPPRGNKTPVRVLILEAPPRTTQGPSEFAPVTLSPRTFWKAT